MLIYHQVPVERIVDKFVDVPVERIVHHDKIVYQDKIVYNDKPGTIMGCRIELLLTVWLQSKFPWSA